MHKLYQAEWLNIRFSSFAELSEKSLAGPSFYQAFYEEFFRRYRSWEELPESWRRGKQEWADFILSRVDGHSRVLAVGCGLGFVEHLLKRKRPKLDLTIHEVAPAAWRWIATEFDEDHRVTGFIPECLSRDARFDLIYLATVDYALDDESLLRLLSGLRPVVSEDGGRCLLISASFDDEHRHAPFSPRRLIAPFASRILRSVGLRPPRQFWGWNRSQEEYQSLMRRAGYHSIRDGFMDSENRAHYWIEGGSRNVGAE